MWQAGRRGGGTYEVAVRVLLGLAASAVEKDGGALLLGAGDQFLDSLFALRTDDGPEVGAFFEAAVDVQLLGSCGDFW